MERSRRSRRMVRRHTEARLRRQPLDPIPGPVRLLQARVLQLQTGRCAVRRGTGPPAARCRVVGRCDGRASGHHVDRIAPRPARSGRVAVHANRAPDPSRPSDRPGCAAPAAPRPNRTRTRPSSMRPGAHFANRPVRPTLFPSHRESPRRSPMGRASGCGPLRRNGSDIRSRSRLPPDRAARTALVLRPITAEPGDQPSRRRTTPSASSRPRPVRTRRPSGIVASPSTTTRSAAAAPGVSRSASGRPVRSRRASMIRSR